MNMDKNINTRGKSSFSQEVGCKNRVKQLRSWNFLDLSPDEEQFQSAHFSAVIVEISAIKRLDFFLKASDFTDLKASIHSVPKIEFPVVRTYYSTS